MILSEKAEVNGDLDGDRGCACVVPKKRNREVGADLGCLRSSSNHNSNDWTGRTRRDSEVLGFDAGMDRPTTGTGNAESALNAIRMKLADGDEAVSIADEAAELGQEDDSFWALQPREIFEFGVHATDDGYPERSLQHGCRTQEERGGEHDDIWLSLLLEPSAEVMHLRSQGPIAAVKRILDESAETAWDTENVSGYATPHGLRINMPPNPFRSVVGEKREAVPRIDPNRSAEKGNRFSGG